MPVPFDCDCGQRWWSPPDVRCVACGSPSASTPDPVVWAVSRVDSDVFLSAQLRDRERFDEIVSSGVDVFVDIAGAANYIWRPRGGEIERSGVGYVLIEGVEDTNVDLPDYAFDRVADALGRARQDGRKALVFCAAGLKRSPHLLYGVLRSWDRDADEAWEAIARARPFVDPWPPYLRAAERWAASRA